MKNALIIIALLVSVIGYNLWPYLHNGIFYKANAITLFLLFFSHRLEGKVNNKLTVIACWLCASNLIDEFFFDPKEFGINEYIFAIIVIYITITTKNADR